jgi:hypothetical protein
VNLFVLGEGALEAGGVPVKLAQHTRYPWDGRVEIAVDPKAPAEFALRVRIPGWARGRPLPGDLYRYAEAGPADGVKLAVNGTSQDLRLEQGFAVLRRTWKAGDRVELDLPMPVRRVLAHEAVEADRSRVALERGPVVYCVEGADHDGRALHLVLPDDAKLAPEPRPDLLGGVTVLRGEGRGAFRQTDGSVELRPAALTAIPYYAWCHRGPNEMQVWLPRSAEGVTPVPLPTIASSARASASHCHAADATSALNDQAEPKNSGDHDLPRFTWWDHRGTGEWVQYDLPKRAKVSAVEVYWFDDTGRGQCRVPKSWRLLTSDGDTWKPVSNPSTYETRLDAFNKVTFDPVTTAELRLEATLQAEFSGGILEWRAGER